MMTLLRNMLLAFLCLMFLATSASAECAWILWSTVLDIRTEVDRKKTERIEHTGIRAFQSQGTCEQAIPKKVESLAASLRQDFDNVSVSPDVTSFGPSVSAKGLRAASPQCVAKEDSVSVRISCWPLGLQAKDDVFFGGAVYPHTVDPRRPKGK